MAVWRTGKNLSIPDTFSHFPVSHCLCQEPYNYHLFLCSRGKSFIASRSQLVTEELQVAARADPDYIRHFDYFTYGFTILVAQFIALQLEVVIVPMLMGIWSHIYQRKVIPIAYRRHTLDRLHDSHRGAEATKCRTH